MNVKQILDTFCLKDRNNTTAQTIENVDFKETSIINLVEKILIPFIIELNKINKGEI